MITNITITCTTDDPNHAPVTLDLSTPGASFFLEHLAHQICPGTPTAYPPDTSYDYNPSIANFLKDISNDLQLHREGEHDANRKARDAISKHALDEIAEVKDKLLHDESACFSFENPNPKVPDYFTKTMSEMGSVLRAVGTPWREIVEDFHSRHPMDDATKRRLLELACFPEELVVWKYDA